MQPRRPCWARKVLDFSQTPKKDRPSQLHSFASMNPAQNRIWHGFGEYLTIGVPYFRALACGRAALD